MTSATNRKTLSEAIIAAKAPVLRKEDPEDLLDYAINLLHAAGVRLRQRAGKDRLYLNAMSTVIASCELSGVHPRIYIRAQVDTAGFACQMRGHAMQPGCFFGPNADKRYRDWLARNKRREQAGSTAQADRDRAIRASSEFVSSYFADGDMAAAIDKAGGVIPEWTPDMMGPAERVAALCHGMALYEASLPDRIIPPAEWTWEEARAFLLRIMDVDPDPAQSVQLSDDLGDFA